MRREINFIIEKEAQRAANGEYLNTNNVGNMIAFELMRIADALEKISDKDFTEQKKSIVMDYSKYLGAGSCDVYNEDKGIFYAEEYLGIPHKEEPEEKIEKNPVVVRDFNKPIGVPGIDFPYPTIQ